MAIRHVKSVDDFKEIVESNSQVLVDFFATWCGPCKMLAPVLEGAAAKLEGDVVIAKVDIDENSDLANAFRVQSVPTLVFFKDSKAVLATAGYMDETGLMRFIDAAKEK